MTERDAGAEGVEELRKRLDKVDAELLRLFEKRMAVVAKIGRRKRVCGVPIYDRAREELVVDSRIAVVDESLRKYARALVETLMTQAKKAQADAMNLYLIGMPDCGKTRLGKKLSNTLSMPLLDMDKHIMRRMDMSIDAIFEKLGEEAFRSFESTTLKSIAEKGGHIVATGGGTPFYNNNSEIMKNSGITVFLDRKLDMLLNLDTVNRPLLRQSASVEESVKRLYAARRAGYCSVADMAFDPDEIGVIERIAASYKERLAAMTGE